MRIVIDMQGAQSEGSRNRGIGRYSLSLAEAIARNRGGHEIVFLLNAAFPETIAPLLRSFEDILPRNSFAVWSPVLPCHSMREADDWRRLASEKIREAAIARLEPDAVLVTSLFEGFDGNAVTSIKSFAPVPTAVVLYDLIPYIYPDIYQPMPHLKRAYRVKMEQLKRADLALAISDSARGEAIKFGGFAPSQCVNISAAAADHFRPLSVSADAELRLRRKFGLNGAFVMYTGGIEYRKNIDRLIVAYARLPDALRRDRQLAIVCKATVHDASTLSELAASNGLEPSDVVFTGYVSDEELVALYNLCTLFVFPSLHEGFGLPALEAMRCGAPTIAGNNSSLPEVVGRGDAVFDSKNVDSISAKMAHALADETFRKALADHGLQRAQSFSWDRSAIAALKALETLNKREAAAPARKKKPRLAYVSPMPPERSGIADYSAEMLPALSHHYRIDVVCVDPGAVEGHRAISIENFKSAAFDYNRILYHFGNSPFHDHMLELLRLHPGVVVLHDFFLSGMHSNRQFAEQIANAWTEELYRSHGYPALEDFDSNLQPEERVRAYPCSGHVFQNGIGTILHSAYAASLARQAFSIEAEDARVVPLARAAANRAKKSDAKARLGIEADAFLVCSFGIVAKTKLSDALIDAFAKSQLASSREAEIILVGANDPGPFGATIIDKLQSPALNAKGHVTGWVDTETYRLWLSAADVAVQLRTDSRGETSAAVLDCLNYGLPTIVNANGSMAELPDDAVVKLPDRFTEDELVQAMETLWQGADLRKGLARLGRTLTRERHDPAVCAAGYADAIETFYERRRYGVPALVKDISKLRIQEGQETPFSQVAAAIAGSLPSRGLFRQLLIDISELLEDDGRTGIQRVVRALVSEMIAMTMPGWRVEPVFARGGRYCYARRFGLSLVGAGTQSLPENAVEFRPGDVFFGLDLHRKFVANAGDFLAEIRARGVETRFAVYDLLCARMPHNFLPGAAEGFNKWLSVVAEADGAICISKAVAEELRAWVAEHAPHRVGKLKIDWFHLGADIENSAPTQGLPGDAPETLAAMAARPSFLMVSTLEPRKAHAQALGAFERLWADGTDVNLVIVGRQGWMVETLMSRLRAHPGRGHRLHLLEGISDEYLGMLYAAATALLAASEGEGFGLPLIEAARHGLPLIARDIPVFREVAGEHAFYFSGLGDHDLEAALKAWLSLHAAGYHPASSGCAWLTWKESAANLRKVLGIASPRERAAPPRSA